MSEKTYADRVNGQFKQCTSNFVSLQKRLIEALELNPVFNNMLDGAVDEFKRRNKSWKSFSDLSLCQAIPATLDKVLIDTTLQRPLNIRHIIKILSYFKQTMVMPIQVYEDESKPGYFIAWDGQHTAISLYIIASKVFGERLAKISVPVVVYPTKEKLEIRRNFILLNGDAKEPLDFIDTYKQMVHGVRSDGATDETWVATELKQQYLESAGLFATNNKFGDEDQAGAFTLLADTLMTKNLAKAKSPKVTEMFAKYWSYLNQERAVQAKEARQLYEYFDACFNQEINVDDAYIRTLVDFTKEFFEADFSETGQFWDKVKDCYTNWYRTANQHSDDRNEHGEVIVRGYTTEWRCGGPVLIAHLRKHTDLQTPSFTPNNGFKPMEDDLWQ